MGPYVLSAVCFAGSRPQRGERGDGDVMGARVTVIPDSCEAKPRAGSEATHIPCADPKRDPESRREGDVRAYRVAPVLQSGGLRQLRGAAESDPMRTLPAVAGRNDGRRRGIAGAASEASLTPCARIMRINRTRSGRFQGQTETAEKDMPFAEVTKSKNAGIF
jgi:hypothetical protein